MVHVGHLKKSPVGGTESFFPLRWRIGGWQWIVWSRAGAAAAEKINLLVGTLTHEGPCAADEAEEATLRRQSSTFTATGTERRGLTQSQGPGPASD